ncbi:MAG: hypothetical protein ACJ8C6_09315 [Microvirga sp.]|jgi:hypothetical protein
MDDLFASIPSSPTRPRKPVMVPVNNDVVLARFRIVSGPEQVAHGRVAQMLATLVSSGSAGVTSAQFSAGVRVSDSIHKLRHRHSLIIETERVGHGGIFAGEHAIYRLSSTVDIIELVRADEMRTRKRQSGGERRYAAL